MTQAQVGRLLGLGQSTLLLYVDACRRELSPAARRAEGREFSEADLVTLQRFQERLTEEQALVVACAWCGREIGIRPGGGVAGRSHGMCGRCAESFMHEYDLGRVAV